MEEVCLRESIVCSGTGVIAVNGVKVGQWSVKDKLLDSWVGTTVASQGRDLNFIQLRTRND